MRDSSPDTHPRNNLRILRLHPLRNRDIIDRIVEQTDQPRNPHHRQGLTRQCAEHHRRQRRREQGLVDAKVAASVARHVELECQRWEQVHEEDPDRACEGAVGEAVFDVGPVVG